MGLAQLDRVLTDDEMKATIAFLDTLTGRYLGRPSHRLAGRRSRRRPDETTVRCGCSVFGSGAVDVAAGSRALDDTAEYSATLRTFDDFALAEASLHRRC